MSSNAAVRNFGSHAISVHMTLNHRWTVYLEKIAGVLTVLFLVEKCAVILTMKKNKKIVRK